MQNQNLQIRQTESKSSKTTKKHIAGNSKVHIAHVRTLQFCTRAGILFESASFSWKFMLM